MLWFPRRHRAPPSLQLPYGVPGTSPIGLHQRLSGAATITRAGTRWFRNGSAFAELAENTACTELDADSRRYVSVYGEYANVVPNNSGEWSWAYNVTQADSGVASPVAGKNWRRIAETTATNYHILDAGPTLLAHAQNVRCVAQAMVKAGDAARYLTVRVYEATKNAAAIHVNPTTGAIVTTVVDADYVLHDYRSLAVGDGWLIWGVLSGTAASPGDLSMQLCLADGESLSEGSYDSYAGDADAHPNGVLFCGTHLGTGTGPVSLIETAAATVTKSAEVVALDVDDYGIPGGLGCLVRTWDTVPTNKRLWSWYDASTDAAIELFLDADGHVHLRVHDGTGETVDIEVATAVNDGVWHRVRCGWEHNNTWLWVDGTLARDTSCTMPALADLDASRLGASESGQQLDGDIAEFDVYRTRLGA